MNSINKLYFPTKFSNTIRIEKYEECILIIKCNKIRCDSNKIKIAYFLNVPLQKSLSTKSV